jgi:hypothetical protein
LIKKLLKKLVMAENSDKEGILNTLLSILVVGLDVVLVLIALGFIIGLWEILK